MISFLLLSCGYVESNNVSTLMFHTPEPYETELEAVRDLARGLLAKYEQDMWAFRKEKKDCCKAFVKERMQEGDERCPVCAGWVGTSFNMYGTNGFETWLVNLHGYTNDQWGGEWDTDCRWWAHPELGELLDTPRDQILNICEHGEELLIFSLTGEELPSNPTFAEALEEYREDRPAFSEEGLLKALQKCRGRMGFNV